MRTRAWTTLILIAMAAALSVADRAAGVELATKKKTIRYKVVVLDTLGGTQGAGISINNPGWVTGVSTQDGDLTAHATLWRDDETVDLLTLGGPNSALAFPSKNNNGGIVGISETDEDQPLGEIFSCVAFFGTPRSGKVCRGFLWRDGVMTGLDPLPGGDNSFAAGANNHGQVVGWAENSVHDTTCTAPQVLQFRAVIWTNGGDAIQQLPPLGDDHTSAAVAINDKGQVVGISGMCDRARGRLSAVHAVMWENGVPRNLGDLGGVAWNTPTAINHYGDSAGFSNLPTDPPGALNAHAVLWPRTGGIVDLKTLGDDPLSLAFGINAQRQVVGQSIGADGSRAFLWEDGVLMNLNDLVEDGSPFLIFANDINDKGEIAGQGCTDCASGATFAVKLIPQ
jgi:probable HAF family extracellular repeat protein